MSIYASAGYFVAFFAVDFFTFSPDPTRVVAPDPDATGHVGKRQKRRPEPEQPRVEVDVKLNAKRSIIPQTVLAVLLAIQPVVTGGIYLTTLLCEFVVGWPCGGGRLADARVSPASVVPFRPHC